MKRDLYLALACFAVGWCIGWVSRRVHLRAALRRKMRALGMIPVALLAFTSHARAQQSDSLIGTVLSRSKIPAEWQGDPIRVWCVTWHAEREDRPRVLVLIDAEPADTTRRPLCPDPRGGFYPLWIDGPVCPPGNVSPFDDRAWVIVRCGASELARYRRREFRGKAEQ
jgi:hypothetical protein